MNGTALNAQAFAQTGLAPDWVELVPAGDVSGRDGRGWVNDRPELVLAAFQRGGIDLPVDMEHATELLAPQGNPAPALGWVKELQSRSGAIWGKVEWNAAGREAVEGKSYRYVSPVIVFERATKRVVALTSVGLTNRPNLYLQALNGQEDYMDLKKLLAALGLPADAPLDEALAAITALKDSAQKALNAAQNPSLEAFVPRADYDAALCRVAQAEQTLAATAKAAQDQAIDLAIDQALAAGKITPATVDYHKAQCAQDGGLARFAAYCQAAPVIVDPSDMDRRTAGGQGTALNAEERYVCQSLGISEKDFAAHKAAHKE